MRRHLHVVARAERQIRAAAKWWSENRPAAPDLLHRELSRAFELIATQPAIGPEAPDADLPGVRRIHLQRVHYWLYYRAQGTGSLEVLAFWHVSRGDAPPLR